jgi:peptidoglycan/xylan/chitin deacetylase (PgdA/CDA1 family)
LSGRKKVEILNKLCTFVVVFPNNVLIEKKQIVMNFKYLLLFTIFLGVVFTGCKHASQNNSSNTSQNSEDVNASKTTNTAAQILAKKEVPVLCYHRLEDGRKGEITIKPSTFEAHMKILADSGYHSISPTQLYNYLVYNKELPQKPIIITFDDSRVEHYTVAAPILEKHGFKGVFFIMTITYNKKNYMSKDQIAELAKRGHTIGLHTWDHTMVTKYADADWIKEVATPKKGLEKIVGMPVEYFAYPYGIENHKATEELSKYMKLSFILISKRDTVNPLQTIRRMIVPEWSAQGMLKSMHKTFAKSM